VRSRLRFRFRKAGDLRLVSHHDLLRCLERMLRRAGLPFASTEGFNPKPRLTFALSLPLGVVGCDEVLDLELRQELSPNEVRERLARQAPAGLEILSAERVPRKARLGVRSLVYRVGLPAGRAAAVRERAAAVLADTACWIERTRPERRRLDVRPFLRDLRVTPDALEMHLWVTAAGTARPDELLELLGLGDLLAAGAVVERTRLELQDEATNPGPAPGPVFPPVPAAVPEETCPAAAHDTDPDGGND
jgi:radical SAM-linked protein